MFGEFVPRERAAAFAVDRKPRSGGLLQFYPEEVGSSYNRRPFIVRHRLAEHPLLKLESLFALCRRLPADLVKFRRGVIPGDANFDSSYDRFRDGLSLEQTLEHFEELKAYICIYNPERDPTYRPLFEGLLAEIGAAIADIDPVITWYSTYLFISTSGSVTPYHMDREMNFLLQVRGNKEVLLWDPADEDILSPAEKDHLLAAFGSWRPTYKPSNESKAMHFDLQPGIGVHHPFIAPHRVHTLDGLSVSLAFTFRTLKSDMATKAHSFNEILRRLGMSPHPVGENEAMDHAKALASNAVRVPIKLWQARRRAIHTTTQAST
jgi:hypothetical protein